MKYLNKIGLAAFLSLFLVACTSTTSEEATQTAETETVETEKVAVTANAESKLAISGMMCSVGCAGLIEKELNSTAGVASANIVFEDSIASVSFDNSIISENDIIAAIHNLADHQYLATPVKNNEETPAEEVAE